MLVDSFWRIVVSFPSFSVSGFSSIVVSWKSWTVEVDAVAVAIELELPMVFWLVSPLF